MIDLHCHILPGIDDGAATIEDSISMAKEARKQGITKIVATPHHKNGVYENVKDKIIPLVEEINTQLEHADIPIEILPGQEVRIHGELLEGFSNNEILTLGGNSSYIFIEFPSGYIPGYADRLLYDLQLKGLMPIIVHPERNQEIIEQPDKLYQLVNSGAGTQVTAASLTGHFGKKIQSFSEQLISANLTHIIASDAHNTRSRSFKMEQAYERLKKKFGSDYLYYFMENAELVISGLQIDREIPERIQQRKKLFGIF